MVSASNLHLDPAQPGGAFDLLVVNGRVFTADPIRPAAQAVGVRGNRIVFVGSNAEAAALRSSARRTFDAQGCTVLPGLIDSHFHLQMGALRVEDLSLENVRGLDQLGAAMCSYAAAHPDKPWINGHRIAYDVLGNGRMLTRHDLDAIEPRRPVALMSVDYHTLWANTAALEAAGILHGAAVAPGSEVVMGPDGTATGQLNERDAFGLVQAVIPKPTAQERDRMFRTALAEAAAFGITSVHNMDGDATQAAYFTELAQRGDLTLRVYLTYSVRPGTPFENLAGEAAPLRDRINADLATRGLLRCGSVKFFMDGVIDSFTAFMLEPYALPQHAHCGEALWSAEKFSRFAAEADRLGLQIIVHAIGDAAVRRTLDGYAAARAANGPRDSRHRIEHIELLHRDDLPRFAELGAVTSMQPLHASRPERDYFLFWTECVGPQRWANAFPWRSLADAGAPPVFGSDWPVVTMDPFAGIEAAVNRQPWGPGLPSQALTLAETLLAYTQRAAWAEFQEHAKGQLTPGLLADLVVLDADLFACAGAKLAQVRPVLTVCDGRIVYER